MCDLRKCLPLSRSHARGGRPRCRCEGDFLRSYSLDFGEFYLSTWLGEIPSEVCTFFGRIWKGSTYQSHVGSPAQYSGLRTPSQKCRCGIRTEVVLWWEVGRPNRVIRRKLGVSHVYWGVSGLRIRVNSIVFVWRPADSYPFILLNLVLSCLTAIQAPIIVIMMSQNRQEAKDLLTTWLPGEPR